jgi:hypothetical protein
MVRDLDAFTLTLEEIAAEACVGTDVAQAVLDAFTAPASPTNAEFKAFGDFNLAAACPLVRTPNGRYLSLQSYGLYESLYDSPFYWMHADAGYRAEASKHRGAFTEDFVARRLAEVFGPARVHRGVVIKRGTKHVTDIDVLVTFADRAIALQCKSKKLTLAARKGNDLQLRSDFKKSVQDAYDQARISADSLLDPSLTFLDAEGASLAVSKQRTIYQVCVVSDSYPSLTVQARSFLTHTADETVRPPLVTDVFLIDVLAEMLSSPLRLLSYVNRRVSYTGRVNSMNEHAILGFHLSQNLWLEEEYSMAMIDDACAIDLDAAMTVRRGGVPGSPTPDGVLTRFARTPVGRILSAIEHRESVAEVDLGFLLLTLGETAVRDLGKGLEAVAARTRKDGRTHDFTHIFAESEAGLTVHCSPLSDAEALPELRRHCENRKYIHRAGAWHGLLVRAEDGLRSWGLSSGFLGSQTRRSTPPPALWSRATPRGRRPCPVPWGA